MGVGCGVGIFRKFQVQISVIIDDWLGLNIFSKIGLRHLSDIIILRQWAKFHEKISSTARDIQEILLFRRKFAIPAIFRQVRLQKSVFLTIETYLMVGIAINNVFCVKKQRKTKKKPLSLIHISEPTRPY